MSTPEYPRELRLQPLIDLLHDQQIGCNTVRVLWESHEPIGFNVPGWEHRGDHEAVARAILGLPVKVPA